MWDSGFLIEVYSTLCQALLGQCRWAKKVNEKRKKHGSSENVSERKTAGREKGRACSISLNTLTWDQAQFSFRFLDNIPAGKAKRKQSLIQTFYEKSAANFFDWLTFAESANQNYFRSLFF